LDLNIALRTIVEKGKVTLGFESTKKAILKDAIKLVVIASNCPSEQLKFIQAKALPIFKYPGTNFELGVACGKPYPIATLGIIEVQEHLLQVLKT
jgi:large subunit ribosomal protein L30e